MRGLKVDSWEGLSGGPEVYLMPEGTPVRMVTWREEDGTYYGMLDSGDEFPIVEITAIDGRKFKYEPDSTAAA